MSPPDVLDGKDEASLLTIGSKTRSQLPVHLRSNAALNRDQ